MRSLALLSLLLVASPALAEEEPTVEELLRATDDITRGESSRARVEMHVRTARYERTLRMEAWAEGTEKTLIRILSPARDAGTATLKVGDNIWNYLPRVDRTMRLPAGMMAGSWMGSHFTNDDLVQETRYSEDYDAELTARPADDPDGNFVVTLTPKAEAPVVWGQVVVRVRPDRLPVDVRYFDERGNLARTMTFDDYREFDGRRAPSTLTLVPDVEGEFTRLTYLELEFDVDIPPGTFTLEALRR